MLVRQLTRQLTTSLNSALSGVASDITRVLIDLSPTSSAFYSLGTDSVLTTAYTLSIDAILRTSSTTYAIYGKASDANNYLKILSNGYLSLDVDGTVVTSTTLATKDSKLRNYSVTLSGNDFIFKESGETVSTVTNATAAAKTLTLNLIGKSNAGEFYFGILSNSNINGLNFALNQSTDNTETNNGVTLTYQNIGTASTIRDTYTQTNGDLLGGELVINGDFSTDTDWSKSAGWTISGGQAICTTSTSDLIQENVMVNNIRYRLEVDILTINPGVSLNSWNRAPIFIGNSTGLKLLDFTNNNLPRLTFYTNNSGITIDNVSVKRKIEVV